jgi:hypothetical protein
MMQHQGMPDLTMDHFRTFTPQHTEVMMASYTRQSRAASAGWLAHLGEARRNMDALHQQQNQLHQQQNQNASSLNSDVGLMAYTGVRTESLIQMMTTAHAMASSPRPTARPAPPASPGIIIDRPPVESPSTPPPGMTRAWFGASVPFASGADSVASGTSGNQGPDFALGTTASASGTPSFDTQRPVFSFGTAASASGTPSFGTQCPVFTFGTVASATYPPAHSSGGGAPNEATISEGFETNSENVPPEHPLDAFGNPKTESQMVYCQPPHPVEFALPTKKTRKCKKDNKDDDKDYAPQPLKRRRNN